MMEWGDFWRFVIQLSILGTIVIILVGGLLEAVRSSGKKKN